MRSALQERQALRDLSRWMAEDGDAAVILATLEQDLDADDIQIHVATLDTTPEHLIMMAGGLLTRARERYLALLDQDRARALAGLAYVEAMLQAFDPDAELAA